MNGFFITFEGGEGSGKTTQISRVAGVLRTQGHDVVETREPGGTPIGQALRQILLRPQVQESQSSEILAPQAELLLLLADRAQHIHDVIRPNLEAGHIVLCDRYADSTTAYQGHARGFDLDEIARLNAFVCGECWPQLTFVLDLPVEIGMQRANERRGDTAVDHFEAESVAFHGRVREGFLHIAQTEQERVCVIDAAHDIEAVHTAILDGLCQRLPTLQSDTP